jgi:hypothetical protein
MILTIFGAPVADKFGWNILETATDTIGELIFGIKEDTLMQQGSMTLTTYAATVVFMMIWLIIFVTFGDIISSFSSFSEVVSWVIAFCLATITAMTGGINGMVLGMTKVFVGFGAAAIYIALGASFVVFLLVELGITPAIGWIKGRKKMQKIVKGNMTFKQATSAVKNLSDMQEEVAKKQTS